MALKKVLVTLGGAAGWFALPFLAIDIEISASVLEQLRQAVEWQEAHSIAEAVSLVKSYASRESLNMGSPLEFPMSTVPQLFYQDHAMDIAFREDYCWDLDKNYSSD